MSVVYRFRVTFEEYDEITRDIEIKSTQFFSDLHTSIQSAIGFDHSKPASFYMSNDNWIKGREISAEIRTNKEGEKSVAMQSSRLCDFIADPHQKIYYISDYDANWCFQVELVKIIPQEDAAKLYPVCVKSTGDAPKQYVVLPAPKAVATEDDEFAALLAGEEDDAADESEEKESLLGDTEDGVEEDELEGMGEEGEEESGEEEGEMGFSDADGEEDQKEDY